MKKKINPFLLEAVKGDIANQKNVEAVVNAANAQLTTGGGVAGALHSAAGPGLYEECRPLAPIKPGEAVITSGYDLPNKFVIHCLGPVYGRDKPSEKLLADCYKNALKLAEKHKISSVAFPSISTGAFGYPFKEALQITFDTILNEIEELKHVHYIKFVLYSEHDYNGYSKKIQDL